MLAFLNRAVELVPEVKAHLSDKALSMLKSYDYYYRSLTHLVSSLYNGQIGGDFIDIMQNLIHGQLSNAYETALQDNGLVPGDASEAMRLQLQNFIESDQGFVESFYKDIVDARVDGTPLEPLLKRVDLWANRWNEVYNGAVTTIASERGGKLIWKEGDTKDKCDTCVHLDGIVAFASEWEQSGVHPQGAPNQALICGGWNCGCSLEPTDKRRSPNALQRIMDIATTANVGKSYNPNQPRDDIGRWTDESNGQSKEEKEAIEKINYIAEKMNINKNDIVYGSMPDNTDSIGAYRPKDGKIFIDIKKIINIGVDPGSVFAHEAEHKYYYDVFKKQLSLQHEAINKLAENGDFHFEDGLIKDEYIEWVYENYPAVKASSIINNAINSSVNLTPYADKFKLENPEKYITETMAEVARLLSNGDKVPDIWLSAYYAYRGIK